MGFFSLPHVIESQSLHGKSFAMLWVLLQDGISMFDGLLVLLHFVLLYHIPEQILLLLWKRPILASLGVVIRRHGIYLDDERAVACLPWDASFQLVPSALQLLQSVSAQFRQLQTL